MRFILVTILSALFLCGCRTTKEDDKRFFAELDKSKGVNASRGDTTVPTPNPGVPPPPIFPDPGQGLGEDQPFRKLCEAGEQLPPSQALTVKALLVATHQQECAAAEAYLQDERNKRLMIESEELIELETLAVLKAYDHIRELWITIAKGVERRCPLRSDQVCHFREIDLP